MGYEVVDHIALNSKWIAVTQYGILDLADCSMLTGDCTWGKVVMFHFFASCSMELVLELLC